MSAAGQIDKKIAGLPDWRGKELARLRKLINEAEPRLKEEWKWGTPVWTHNGLVCAVAVFKDHLKVNFFRGKDLNDPHGLFNAGLDAKTTRAVDIQKGDEVNEPALKALVREAARLNET
jgi:hypothetical protein